MISRKYITCAVLGSLLAVAVACCSVRPSSGFVHARGSALIAADGQKIVLHGVNLANWQVPEGYMLHLGADAQAPHEIEAFVRRQLGADAAQRFWRAYRDAYIREDDIRFLHETGLNSLRIPLHYKFFMPGETEGFALLDRVVGWAEKYNMYVIFDMHAAPGGQTGTNIDDSEGYPELYDSANDQKLLMQIWVRIAEHYRNNKTVLGYDLLNEPVASKAQWLHYNLVLEPIYKRITAAIRRVDPDHVIIVEGAQWGSNFTIFGPPFDTNVIYSFHLYWTEPMASSIRPYLDFRARYDVPIYLGESGENNDAWITSFVAVLKQNDIGWAFWPYKKMDSASSFVSWQKPFYWDEITAFSDETVAPFAVEWNKGNIFKEILQEIPFSHCRVNAGYLAALGLKEP